MSIKNVVVTGCSIGGIGAALCEEFHKRGHKVFAASRRVESMEGLSEGIHKVRLDVNDEESIKSGVEEIIRIGGKIDILINNAGQGDLPRSSLLIINLISLPTPTGCVGPMTEVSLDKMRQTFDVNVFGLVAMVQAVGPHMIKERTGTIVNIGSIVGYFSTPWAGVYCASKAAVHSLSDTMRMELRGFGINVICVAPGAIKSNIGASAKTITRILKPDSAYSNVEPFVKSRIAWSQSPDSTPAPTLAISIANAALSSSPPSYLTEGHKSTAAWYSFYLPTSWKEYFWGKPFGIDEIGKA